MATTYGTLFNREPAVTWGLVICVFCLLIQWVMVGLFIWQLPPEIPLWYSLPAGKLQLASRNWFLIIPELSLAMGVVNMLLLRLAPAAVRVYAALHMWLTTLVIFLATIAMLHIILLAL